MEGVGSCLKAAREKKGVSLRELSRMTRINRGILEALERDPDALLLPDVVVRRFIESYARAVGLDPRGVLSLYTQGHVAKVVTGRQDDKGLSRRLPLGYLVAGALGAILVIVAALLILPTGKGGGKGAGVLARVNEGEVSRSRPRAATRAAPAMPQAVVERGEGRHILVLKASERTWVQIKDGDAPPFDFILSQGETYTRRTPNQVTILLGNAGTVSVTFDGKELGTLGEAGAVVTRTLPTPDGG